MTDPEKVRRRTRAIVQLTLGGGALISGALLAYLTLSVGLPLRGAYAALGSGVVSVAAGIINLLVPARRAGPRRTITREVRRRAWTWIAAGSATLALAFVVGRLFAGDAVASGVLPQLAVYVPAGLGGLALAWGLILIAPVAGGEVVALEHVPGIGYRTFVALRYLLDRKHQVTLRVKLAFPILIALRLLLWLAGVGGRFAGWHEPLHVVGLGLGAAILLVVIFGMMRYSQLAVLVFVLGVTCAIAVYAFSDLVAIWAIGLDPMLSTDLARRTLEVLNFVMIGGGALAFLAMIIGALRGFFTFFTTVPIVGVWIGTMALVLVLAVMSGFETDLRDKILGSNAHIQITREEGEFRDWREAKAKIDAIPGVVASTPFAVSEVVMAANNNGMSVIIKGIDPDTVANVTDLVDDLEDPDAMRRLQPLVDEQRDRTVPQRPRPSDVIDPPPDDMVTGGDPIDFSAPPSDPPADAGAPTPTPPPPPPPPPAPDAAPAGDVDVEPVSPYGGDAARIIDFSGGTDWLYESETLRWFIGDHDDFENPAIRAIDLPIEPTLSRRTQALSGILVGRELVKQTHLYTGEEVRVVSPLSDPSNPDATGTPIPFNRDYRVAGVFYTGMYEYDLKYVYVTLDSLQDFLDLGDSVDGIEVRVGSADDTGRYVPTDTSDGLLRQALGPGYRIQDWRELNRSLFSALKLEKIAMFLVLGIVILVASFSIIGNLIMVVVEKAREIALLKTLGAADSGVMQLFAIQGLIIGLIGTALGVVLGLGGCAYLEEYGLPLDPDVYYINRLPIHVDMQSVAAAAFTGVLISILATLYPALLAARVRPADGMRH